MVDTISYFEEIVRRSSLFTDTPSYDLEPIHPFDERNIHPCLPKVVRKLFDNGHYAQATFEAFKFLDKEVKRHSGLSKSGTNLMEQAFSTTNPIITINPMKTDSHKDEQLGFQRLFSGSVLAIRNPRGHEFNVNDTPDQCLDHLALVSLLLRRLDDAGFKCSKPI